MSGDGKKSGSAWLMSTPMIKGELQALLVELAPDKTRPKGTRLQDLCDFAVGTFSTNSEDARQLRAIELTQVICRNERR